jgi:hypothetical protein
MNKIVGEASMAQFKGLSEVSHCRIKEQKGTFCRERRCLDQAPELAHPVRSSTLCVQHVVSHTKELKEIAYDNLRVLEFMLKSLLCSSNLNCGMLRPVVLL